MNIFLICYIFFFKNKHVIKYNNLKLSLKDNNNNNNNTKPKIYISKKYILDMMNSDSTESIEPSLPKSILNGVNYAYPYEDHNENNKILNNINKNLNEKKQLNILNNKKVSNYIKLKIASEYLYMNTTKYKININNGGLFDDWLFNF